MGTIIGVVVGYAFGSRAGERSWEEIRRAWSDIARSPEARDLAIGGLGVLRQVFARYLGAARQLQQAEGPLGGLRRVA
jgi:hypothetical protein